MEKRRFIPGLFVLCIFLLGFLAGSSVIWFGHTEEMISEKNGLIKHLSEKNEILKNQTNEAEIRLSQAESKLKSQIEKNRKATPSERRSTIKNYLSETGAIAKQEVDSTGDTLLVLYESAQEVISEVILVSQVKDNIITELKAIKDIQANRISILEEINETYKELNNDLVHKNWRQKVWLKIKGWSIPVVAVLTAVGTLLIIK